MPLMLVPLKMLLRRKKAKKLHRYNIWLQCTVTISVNERTNNCNCMVQQIGLMCSMIDAGLTEVCGFTKGPS